ncbi:cytochrome P450 [Aspergillus stella-maris]|uniref:cytochrome P450 n=1 Tax=Aspergillus stella-maris TaxID=1810926 RepID=UPI003CCDE737
MTAIVLLAVIGYSVFLHPLTTYLIDKKSLRQFPSAGNGIAGITALWRIIQIHKKAHFQSVYYAHQEHGTHVRIGPSQLSISDPQAMNEIYGHGAAFEKDAFYDAGAAVHRSMADTRSREEHARKRKLLSHVFAQRTVVGMEPAVRAGLEILVSKLATVADEEQEINIRRWLNWYSIDFMGIVAFGKALGCVERGNDLVDARTPEGNVYQVPFVKSLHDMHTHAVLTGAEPSFLPLSTKVLSMHSGVKATRDWGNIVNNLYHNRITTHESATESNKDDIFSKLLKNSKGEDLNLEKGEIMIECSVMMNAGTETNTAVMVSVIYHIYKHPNVLRRLREELDEAVSPDVSTPYQAIATLPYLRACIDEAMRIRPASTQGFPRVVPKGGRMIAGRFVEEGVTVSVPTYTLLQDPTVFPYPFSYKPERWLEGNKAKLLSAFYPFSHGPRACIGRNISYFEQTLLVATLVRNFDIEFCSERYETIERFNGNPGELFARVKKRVVSE